MANKFYISAPLSTEWSDVVQLAGRLQLNFTDVRFWDRRQYKSDDFDEADDVVFMLPHNSVAWYIDQLPNGVKIEVRNAVCAGKRIHIAYRNPLSGNYEITEAKVDGGFDKGTISIIPGFSLETIYDYSDKNIDAVDGIPHYSNPCAEITLPNSQAECSLPIAKRVHATTISNPDYVESDERLLLMM